jgi:hypothetical protein
MLLKQFGLQMRCKTREEQVGDQPVEPFRKRRLVPIDVSFEEYVDSGTDSFGALCELRIREHRGVSDRPAQLRITSELFGKCCPNSAEVTRFCR